MKIRDVENGVDWLEWAIEQHLTTEVAYAQIVDDLREKNFLDCLDAALWYWLARNRG